jgi:hypothetical protein
MICNRFQQLSRRRREQGETHRAHYLTDDFVEAIP